MANRQIYATGSILDDKRKFQILKSVMAPRSLDGCKRYTTALDTPAASVVGRYPKRPQIHSNFLRSRVKCPLWQRRSRRPKKDWHLCKARPLGTPSRIGLREPSFRAVLLNWRSVRHDQMSGLVWMASCLWPMSIDSFS